MSAIHSPSKPSRLPVDEVGGASPYDTGEQFYSLPVLHQDAATFTLIVDSEFFDTNPSLSVKPADWGEESNIKVFS